MRLTNILVVEDDEIVQRTIERCLRGSENRIRLASTGVEGLQAARREIPDLVILDVVLPGMDGITVCKELRNDALLSDVPVLFLTARTRDEDKIAGLIAGGDDYICKPFNIDELILRIQAVLRRTRNQQKHIANDLYQSHGKGPVRKKPHDQPEEAVLVIGQNKLYTRSYQFYSPQKGKIRLTPVQYDLLYHMMSHPGEVFTPGRLLEEIWDYPYETGSPDLVRVHIKNLRERVEEDPRNPRFIKTVAGFGYTIEAAEDGEEVE